MVSHIKNVNDCLSNLIDSRDMKNNHLFDSYNYESDDESDDEDDCFSRINKLLETCVEEGKKALEFQYVLTEDEIRDIDSSENSNFLIDVSNFNKKTNKFECVDMFSVSDVSSVNNVNGVCNVNSDSEVICVESELVCEVCEVNVYEFEVGKLIEVCDIIEVNNIDIVCDIIEINNIVNVYNNIEVNIVNVCDAIDADNIVNVNNIIKVDEIVNIYDTIDVDNIINVCNIKVDNVIDLFNIKTCEVEICKVELCEFEIGKIIEKVEIYVKEIYKDDKDLKVKKIFKNISDFEEILKIEFKSCGLNNKNINLIDFINLYERSSFKQAGACIYKYINNKNKYINNININKNNDTIILNIHHILPQDNIFNIFNIKWFLLKYCD